jgi:hypothetical protein
MKEPRKSSDPVPAAAKGPPRPPVTVAAAAGQEPEGENVYLPEEVSVRDLSAALKSKPFRIISDAMEAGEFHSIDSRMSFQTASAICSKHGVTAFRKQNRIK